MKFIPDEEILLNSENDLLSLKQYVSTLQEVILNVPQDIKSSFTIGLFGEWGSGKSSIVKTVEKELADQKGSIIKFIIYDAWKYANDSFRRMLLLKLQQELELDKTDLMNSFYLNEAEDVKIIKKFNWSYFLVIAVFAIIAIILVYESNISTDSKITMSIIVSILGVFLGLFKKAFDEFKVSIHKPHLFAPEQFEECFNEMTQKAFQNQSTYKKIEKWAKGKPSQKKVDKLVIVIDNIDRCQKELAYELLTNIKNFLGTNKNIIFIIPVDDDALKKHIQYSNKDENSTESNEFLRKFFNVTVRLKKLKRYDIYSFAKKINDKYLLGLNSTTIGIIGKEFASNPRRIIQLYNNLTAEFSNYDSEFINENESVICKMLILRDEWTPYYNLICRNPYLLNDPDGKTNGEIRKSDGLTNFLNKTNSVTQNVDLKVLNKILMNEDDFTGIPDSVIEGIENLDKKTLADFVEDDSIKLSLLFDFIIENLNSFIKNDRSLSTLNYFKVILILNSNQVIPNHINWRIQNEVELTLHNIVEKGCGDLNKDLVKYSEDLNLKSISYLKKFLMYQVNDEFRIDDYSKTKESSKTILRFMVNIYKDSSLTKLSEPFLIEYKTNTDSFTDFDIADDQFKYIVSQELKEYVVGSIEDITLDDPMFNDLIYLSSHYSLLIADIKAIFARIIKIKPSFADEDQESIISIIKVLNKLFANIKSSVGEISELDTFYKTIKERIVSGTTVRITQASLLNADDVNELLTFIYNIYRITLNKVSTVSEFKELFGNTDSYEKTKDKILELKNREKITLIGLFDIILSDESYDDKTFELLKYSFTERTDEKYLLDEIKLNKKLNELVSLAISEDGSGTITNFLEDSLDDLRIKESLIEIITKKTKDEILSLSSILQELAFDYICGDNRLIETYQDATELLKAIASNGKEIHLKELTNLIIEKLIHKESSLVYELLDLTNEFSGSDRAKLLSHLKDYDEVDESLLYLKNSIAKLEGKRDKSIFEEDNNGSENGVEK